MCVHAYTHIHTHTHMHMCVHVCVHACVVCFTDFFSFFQNENEEETGKALAYPLTCRQDKHLTSQLQYLQSHALASNTLKVYSAGVTQHLKFYSRYSLQPVPAHKHTMAFFASALSRFLSPKTIWVYISSVA